MNEIAAAIEYLKTHAANIRAGAYHHIPGIAEQAAEVDELVDGLEWVSDTILALVAEERT